MANGYTNALDKRALIQQLGTLAALMRLSDADAKSTRLYEQAVDDLRVTDHELDELARDGFRGLPHISVEVAHELTRAVNMGALQKLKALEETLPSSLLTLANLPGLGHKRVRMLWQELGVRDMRSLLDACSKGLVRALHGFGAQLETRLESEARAALASTPRPDNLLGDIEPIAQSILAALQKAPAVERVSLAGDVRRAEEVVDAIDVVVATEDPGAVASALHECVAVGQVLTSASDRFVAYLVGRKVLLDVRVVPNEAFVVTLLWRTGNHAHWQELVQSAARRGYTLTRHDLRRDGKSIPIGSEAEFYGLLGLAGIPAELRQGKGELDAAAARRIPKLVTEPDVLGCIHSHSTWSDGEHSLLEMARAAQALGFRYLTITEHTTSSPGSRGLSAMDLERQWTEITSVQHEVRNLKLLRGIESDIRADGSLDLPDTLLGRLDVVIGSIHERFGQSPAQMTERLLHALDHPSLHILGHPFGRLIAQREPIQFDFDAVAQKAKRRGVALEVNGNPDRLDLSGEYVRRALEKGCKLVVSSDAHSVNDLSRVRYAVRTARRGWATRDDILNTLSSEEFLKALRNKPHGRTSS